MPKCTFCGNSIEKGTGKMFVFVSGKVNYFCSNKCEKNLFKLKRKPLRIKWTEAYRKEKGSLKAPEVIEEASAGIKKDKK